MMVMVSGTLLVPLSMGPVVRVVCIAGGFLLR
jgi:hypothetical protein